MTGEDGVEVVGIFDAIEVTKEGNWRIGFEG